MARTSAPPAAAARPEFFRGARSFAPLAISIAAYGVVWGVLAGQAGMSVLEVLLMSGLVFAGASQFVVLDMWSTSALPVVSIIVATAIINLRMVLMSATMRPLVAHLPRWRAMLTIALVTDEDWALTMGEVGRGRGSVAFFLGAATLCYVTWVGATVAGRLVGAAIDDPTTYGLDFAFTATFLALLFGMWKGRLDLIPWIAAAVIAIATARLVPGNWYIIAGGIGGSFIGALIETRRTRHAAS